LYASDLHSTPDQLVSLVRIVVRGETHLAKDRQRCSYLLITKLNESILALRLEVDREVFAPEGREKRVTRGEERDPSPSRSSSRFGTSRQLCTIPCSFFTAPLLAPAALSFDIGLWLIPSPSLKLTLPLTPPLGSPSSHCLSPMTSRSRASTRIVSMLRRT
jgi:hypothetical protein